MYQHAMYQLAKEKLKCVHTSTKPYTYTKALTNNHFQKNTQPHAHMCKHSELFFNIPPFLLTLSLSH